MKYRKLGEVCHSSLIVTNESTHFHTYFHACMQEYNEKARLLLYQCFSIYKSFIGWTEKKSQVFLIY